ncbi:MAG: anti-sigma factor antagonist [Calditrichaeota bacterium]|nr:MAG: anti-sigma factor antagonist [Calditrichota bacterium]
MGITTQQKGNVLIVELEGQLMGGVEADDFRTVIDDALRGDVNQIVVDMAKVKWMNSSGQGMLVSALATLRAGGGDLKLANLSERVRRPLQFTRLDSVFEQYDSVDEAVKTFA